MTHSRLKRGPLRAGLLVALVLGIGCLNYTTGHGLEHHRDVAAEFGLPGPCAGIFYAGVIVTVVTAFALGMTFGRSKPSA